MFKHRHNNPKIELITNAPSFNKSRLVNVENGYIAEYAEKYGERLLNVRSNPIKKKKIEYSAQIETEAQLKARIAKLENKLKIKDDTVNKTYYYDTVIHGKRYKTMARYCKKPKEKAYEQISSKKQKLIKELTIKFE